MVGRIAAFTNKKYKNKGDDVPVGALVFLIALTTRKQPICCLMWPSIGCCNKGMEAMDGPINFGERDRWWGLVVEGFQEPLYCMNYNPPYYQHFLKPMVFKLFLTRSVLA